MEIMKKAANNESVAQLHDQNYKRVLLKYKARGWPLHQLAFPFVEKKLNGK
jgi:hypothetical protein